MGNTISELALAAGGTVALVATWKLTAFIWRQINSPLGLLPGPSSSSLLLGNYKEMWSATNLTLHDEWADQYGSTFRFHGLFSMYRLYTSDPKALNHILTHPDDFQKPYAGIYALSKSIGAGVLVVEGDRHRRQRRMINPAFGPAQIRELTPIIVDKSIELRSLWTTQISQTGSPIRIDVLKGLSRTALDIIGLAGFNYSFNSLSVTEDNQDPLYVAFEAGRKASRTMAALPILQAWIPPLRLFNTTDARLASLAKASVEEIGHRLLRESRTSGTKPHGRDLLSLLIKANMDPAIPEEQRLSDEDVVAQIGNFLAAGHETSSVGATWTLFALATHPAVQQKLRKELHSFASDSPTMDELNSLQYLDWVVREALRLHPPVPMTFRECMKDDVVPLERPYVKDGVEHNSFRISKGDGLIVPIIALNRSKEYWGPDAGEFKPERWASVPGAVSSVPGVWSNLLTFLGGPHACIGYRFALVEMKAMLFTLVKSLRFELAAPLEDIVVKTAIVQRPALASDPAGGDQLPLLISLCF